MLARFLMSHSLRFAKALSLGLGFCLLATNPALADFPTGTPNSGDTLSSAGNGVTPINAPGSTDVTLNIDGEIITPTSPAINLGGGATINVINLGGDASVIADPGGPFSFALPDIFAVGVVDEATLNATLAPVIGIDSTFGSFNTPLIQLGAGGTSGFSTVNVGLDDVIGSVGSEGILGLNGADIRVVLDGGNLATAANNSAAFRQAGSGTVNFTLTNNSQIATLFNGSSALDGGGANGAVSITMSDSGIYTLGDNSAAILGGVATDSVFNLEIDGRIDRLPTLGTFGNNSPGVVFRGDGGSTATIQVTNAGANAFGAPLRTLGNDSPLLDLDTTPLGNSSFAFTSVNSAFSTAGNNSRVISILTSSGSDTLFLFQTSEFTSAGSDSGLVTYQLGANSISNLVAIDSVLTAMGNSSGGIVLLMAAGSNTNSDTTFLGNTMISTAGNDSPGFLIEEGGANSNRSVTFQNNNTVATQGDSSPGVSIGGLGDGSAMDDTITDTTITTVGDDSPGYFTGQVGSASAKSVTVDNLNVTTQGDRSIAFQNGGVFGTDSVISTAVDNSTFNTAGDFSTGVVLQRNLLGNNSTTVATTSQLNITTTGNASSGLIAGAATAAEQNGGPVDNSLLSYSFDVLNVTTSGNDSSGIIINGVGEGSTSSENVTFLNNLDVTTSGARSVGVEINTDSPGSNDTDITTVIAGTNQIRTSGDAAHGLILNTGTGETASTSSTFTTLVTNVDVETTGDNADGIVLGSGLGENDGVAGGNNLGISNFRSATTGDNANALVISENTFLAHSSAGNPDSSIDTFDTFVATGPGGRSIQNNGTIDGGPNGIVLTPGGGLRGNIANSGTITSSGSDAVTYDTAANTDDIFELQPGGVVNGNVLAGNGNDQLILGGEGTDAFDHTLRSSAHSTKVLMSW